MMPTENDRMNAGRCARQPGVAQPPKQNRSSGERGDFTHERKTSPAFDRSAEELQCKCAQPENRRPVEPQRPLCARKICKSRRYWGAARNHRKAGGKPIHLVLPAAMHAKGWHIGQEKNDNGTHHEKNREYTSSKPRWRQTSPQIADSSPRPGNSASQA